MGQACLWEVRPQGPEGSSSSLSSIQLADVANGGGGPPWSPPVPSCHIHPSPAHIHFGLLFIPSICDLFFGSPTLRYKNHFTHNCEEPQCPDLGDFWPVTGAGAWKRAPQVRTVLRRNTPLSSPVGSGKAALGGTQPHFLPDLYPASPAPSLVSLGTYFLCIFWLQSLISESASGYPTLKQAPFCHKQASFIPEASHVADLTNQICFDFQGVWPQSFPSNGPVWVP